MKDIARRLVTRRQPNSGLGSAFSKQAGLRTTHHHHAIEPTVQAGPPTTLGYSHNLPIERKGWLRRLEKHFSALLLRRQVALSLQATLCDKVQPVGQASQPGVAKLLRSPDKICGKRQFHGIKVAQISDKAL